MTNFKTISLKKSISLFLLMFPLALFAQKEGAIWYFGNHAGLDFNSGEPVAISNSALYTGEGCSTVSDPNGNLLFYTNGFDVYNSNHELMPNGTNLDGGVSSSQSSLIVRKPGSSTIYYVFTTNAVDNFYLSGFNYYEIDMTTEGGLGSITGKNGLPITEFTNPPLATPVSEKLTAVYHADGEQIWVLAHRSDNSQDFLAYLVSSTGVSTTPVVSSVGSIHDRYTIPAQLVEESNLPGCMKFSPDGTKLAVAMGYQSSPFVTNPLLNKGVELFDFDTETGIVSNAITVSNLKSYGVEFSPNSKILYASSTTGVNPDQIFQYDVTLSEETVIQASQTLITTQSPGICTLQLGINGKLYASKIAGGTSIHAINNPNVLGTGCNFQANAISLGGAVCYNGLPNFMVSYFEESIQYDGICAGSPTTFTASPYDDIASAEWNFGDPDSGNNNTSTDIFPTHVFSQGGTYTVTVNLVSNGGNTLQIIYDVVIDDIPIANEPNDLLSCSNSTTAFFDVLSQTAFILGNQPQDEYTVTYYNTEDDALVGTNVLSGDLTAYESEGEIIYVRIENNDSGCYSTTNFELGITETPTAGAVSSLTTCDVSGNGFGDFDLTQQNEALINGQEGVTVTYYINEDDANINNNPIDNAASFINTVNPQQIFARVGNGSCFSITSFTVEVLAGPDTAAEFNLTGCPPFDLTSIAPQGNLTISYYINENDAEEASGAIVNPDNYQTTSREVTLYVRAENTNGCFTVVPLDISVGNCLIPRGISPNGDDKNDNFDLSGFDVSELSIFNRYGEEVYSKSGYSNEWFGQSDKGKELPTGTYYYALKLNDGEQKTGWVYINRQEN